ncbi:MAG: SRPBCC family protein [Bacteroidetes bacterium]|nr:SRPBCC family protein [Bacteroidota bacterium]
MSVHSFTIVQKIPARIDEVWNFFSDPSNLNQITPSELKFEILSAQINHSMYAGQVIEYYVRPLLNLRMYWMTEITHVADKIYFVDEQRFGPYSFWHHQHHFKILDGGVEMKDIVHYKIPLGFIGDIANTFFVRKKLKRIFDFRFSKTEELFGKWMS